MDKGRGEYISQFLGAFVGELDILQMRGERWRVEKDPIYIALGSLDVFASLASFLSSPHASLVLDAPSHVCGCGVVRSN